jgi:hypothetical protein
MTSIIPCFLEVWYLWWPWTLAEVDTYAGQGGDEEEHHLRAGKGRQVEQRRITRRCGFGSDTRYEKVVADPSQVEDAKAAMDIFLTVREEYETHLAEGGDVSGIPPSFAKWYW